MFVNPTQPFATFSDEAAPTKHTSPHHHQNFMHEAWDTIATVAGAALGSLKKSEMGTALASRRPESFMLHGMLLKLQEMRVVHRSTSIESIPSTDPLHLPPLIEVSSDCREVSHQVDAAECKERPCGLRTCHNNSKKERCNSAEHSLH